MGLVTRGTVTSPGGAMHASGGKLLLQVFMTFQAKRLLGPHSQVTVIRGVRLMAIKAFACFKGLMLDDFLSQCLDVDVTTETKIVALRLQQFL